MMARSQAAAESPWHAMNALRAYGTAMHRSLRGLLRPGRPDHAQPLHMWFELFLVADCGCFGNHEAQESECR